MKKILITIVIILLISCTQEKTNKYTEIINYIADNKSLFMHNGLKGIEAMNLWKEQEQFYSARIDYFLSLLMQNNSYKEVYFMEEKKYYIKFSVENKYYFYWSKEIVDFQISHRIHEKFGNILLPLSVIAEFYGTTPELYKKDE